MRVYFDSHGNPVQPSGIRRTLSGAMQFVATPDTTMTTDQWAQRVQQAERMVDQTEANGERVTVIAPGSRDVRIRAGR